MSRRPTDRLSAALGVLILAALLHAAWTGLARADGTGPDGLRGLLHTRSAATAGMRVVGIGVWSSGHSLDDSLPGSHLVSVTHLHVGYAVAREFEVGAALPLRGWTATGSSGLSPSSQVGFGDLLGSAKLVLPLPTPRLRLGMVAQGSFPTGSRSRGMSSEATDFELGGLATVDLTHIESFVPTRIHANVTYRWNRNESRGVGLAPFSALPEGGFWPPAYPPIPLGETPGWNDEVRYRLAFEFETRRMTLATELAFDHFLGVSGTDFLDNPGVLGAEAFVKLSNGIDVAGGADISLQNDDPPATMPQLPDWRFHLGIRWSTGLGLGDGDQDGVADKRDACPDNAEDFDGFEDADGCPDLDNDFDGVPDGRDLAPDLKEDVDGFEDDDGRPDLDNDGDGIRDADDGCPNEPEDYDGDRDTDGCPDMGPQ